MAVKHEELQQIYEELSAPLTDEEIEWKIGVVVNKKDNGKPSYPSKVMLMPYVKHDVVQRRLNTILGFGNWSLKLTRWEGDRGNGITKATLIIHTTELDVTLEDIADDNDSGGIKGSATRALPRVVRLLGMADELYRLPKVWVNARSEYDFDDPPTIAQLNGEVTPKQPAPRPAQPRKPAQPTPEPTDERFDAVATISQEDAVAFARAWDKAKLYPNKKVSDGKRYFYLSEMTGRDIKSAKELTHSEGQRASAILDTFKFVVALMGDVTQWEDNEQELMETATKGKYAFLWLTQNHEQDRLKTVLKEAIIKWKTAQSENLEEAQ